MAANEVRREARAKRRRDSGEIRQRPQGVPRRGLAPNADGIRVLEAERRKPDDAEPPAELGRHVGERLRGGTTRRVTEDREQAGARVLRVHVDRAVPQRRERDLGRAEARPAIHAKSARLQKLREHLAENVRFAERL